MRHSLSDAHVWCGSGIGNDAKHILTSWMNMTHVVVARGDRYREPVFTDISARLFRKAVHRPSKPANWSQANSSTPLGLRTVILPHPLGTSTRHEKLTNMDNLKHVVWERFPH